ncbi:hypothetical protein MTO96_006123 [Rhipicephalus appendiculatus]
MIHFPRISGAFDCSPELLCDALSQNSSVKVLKLNVKHDRTHEDICALISSLVGIEELEFEHNGFCRAPLLPALSALLRDHVVPQHPQDPRAAVRRNSGGGVSIGTRSKLDSEGAFDTRARAHENASFAGKPLRVRRLSQDYLYPQHSDHCDPVVVLSTRAESLAVDARGSRRQRYD